MPQNSSAQLSNARLWDAAVVVKDLDKTVKRLEKLGIGQPVTYGQPEGAEGLFYRCKPLESNMNVHLTRIGNMQIEFNQPDEKPNPWIDFLKKHGEGFHHLGFQVADVEKEVNRLTALGADVPFYGKIKGKIGAAYVNLKVANLFIELTSFCGIPPFTPEKPVYPRAWDTGVVVKDLEAVMKRLEILGIGRFVQSAAPKGAGGLFYHNKPLVSGFKGSGRRVGNLQLDFIQPDGTFQSFVYSETPNAPAPAHRITQAQAIAKAGRCVNIANGSNGRVETCTVGLEWHKPFQQQGHPLLRLCWRVSTSSPSRLAPARLRRPRWRQRP